MEGIIFVAQKIILRLIFPVSLALILGGAGLVLWGAGVLGGTLLSVG